MDLKKESLQVRFLEMVKNKIPKSSSVVYELAEVMDISTESVYRRLRDETSLSFDEICKLGSHFGISVDQLSASEIPSVCFNYSKLNNIDGFLNHWRSIRDQLAKIHSSTHKKIIFAAIDIPQFHHFRFPILMAFKMHYYLREALDEDSFKNTAFSPDLIPKEALNLGREIYQYYSKIPSVEIWTEDTLNITLKQIRFYWESGMFDSKPLAIKVCHELIDVFKLIQQNADRGTKLDNPDAQSNYQLYQSDIEIGSNTILIERDESKLVYLGFHTFNTIITSDEKFCTHTENWLQNVIRKSTQISETSPKQRYQFFKNAILKIEKVITEIQG